MADPRCLAGFSVDPYLSGQLIAETVEGIQEAGVIATTKHFIAQEQETHRIPTRQFPWVQAVSSNVDDKTMHELYMWCVYHCRVRISGYRYV